MIHLRKIEPQDLPFLYRWENDAAAWSSGSTHNPLSQQDLRDYIASTSGDIYRDGQLRLVAEVDGQTVGCIDLFDFDPRNRRAAIGMYVAPEMRGQGLGRAMVQELEAYVCSILHLRTIYAVIALGNVACSAIYRSLSYHPSSPLPHWTLEDDAIVWVKTF